MPKLTIGRTVLYILPLGHPCQGEIRPAIVVKVWSDLCANLHVILDVANGETLEACHQSSVMHSTEPGALRSWHWPSRG